MQIPSPKDVTDAGNVVATWPFWVVILLILVLVVIVGFLMYRSTIRAQSETNAISSKLVDKGNDSTAALTGAIAQLTNLMSKYDVAISLMAAGLGDQNKLLTEIKGISETGNSYFLKLKDSIVDVSRDTSSAQQAYGTAIMENSNRVAAEITTKIVEAETTIPQTTLAGMVPMHDDLVKRLTQAFAAAAADVFDGCIEENKRLTEENDILKRKYASVSQTGVLPVVLDTTPPTEPDPPPPPDHKQPIPGDFDVVATLPRASGE